MDENPNWISVFPEKGAKCMLFSTDSKNKKYAIMMGTVGVACLVGAVILYRKG